MSKKNKKSLGNSGGGAKQFLVWHGEKFIVAVVVVCALWLAMQGFGYQTLQWQPSDLEKTAADARNAIERSERTAADEELKIFDYAGHAEQIKRPVPATPYRNPLGSEWHPVLEPPPPPQRPGTTTDSMEPSEPGVSPDDDPLQEEIDFTESLPESGDTQDSDLLPEEIDSTESLSESDDTQDSDLSP